MQKQELLNRLSDRSGLSKRDVNEVLESLQNEINDLMDNPEESISLPMLGTFSVKETKDRQGINPATKEKIQIKGYRTISFKVKKSVRKYNS